MLNKIKKVYVEWKMVVNLLFFVLAGITAILLANTVPFVSLGIVMLMGILGLVSSEEE